MVEFLTYICDDDRAQLKVIELFLKGKNYVSTRFFDNGARLLAAVNSHTAIAVIDYHLKQTNGIEVAKKIKAKNPNCHIIILSGEDQDITLPIKAMRLGLFDYISKNEEDYLLLLLDALNRAKEHIIQVNNRIEAKAKLLADCDRIEKKYGAAK